MIEMLILDVLCYYEKTYDESDDTLIEAVYLGGSDE